MSPRGGARFYKADKTICMVPECQKKALYRCATQTQRGYCAQHKDHARPNWSESSHERMAAHLLRNAKESA